MSSIAYIYHPACSLHDMGDGHPECPERLNAIEDRMRTAHIFDFVRHYEAPEATRKQLARVHDSKYIDTVLSFSKKTTNAHLDPDTLITPQTPQAALRAAGAAIYATDLVIKKQAKAAFCAVRPPGHHAEHAQAMGFCFFNNIAVAAAHALYEYGLSRVAIVDFDVHHGNGTEHIFQKEKRVLFCSSFQHPFYPYSGAETQSDHIVNSPLPAGAGSDQFRQAVLEQWIPALNKFSPQMLFISAGFDAHYDDDMSHMRLYDHDYSWITQELMVIADKYCEGRIVSTLEGGYELFSLGRSVAAHIKTLMRIN